jgi:flagellar basal-body rod protein FlgC
MVDTLKAAMAVSTSGIAAQTLRIRVISENIANASVTANTSESDPYQRKSISFSSHVDQMTGVTGVKVNNVTSAIGQYKSVFNPNHMAADENGMVKMPKVDVMMEMADMRETVRSYQANVQAVRQARELISMTIDMMRG